MTWKQQPVPKLFLDAWRENAGDVPPPRAYGNGVLRAFVGREPMVGTDPDDLRWHISVSGPSRIPTWEELVDAAHALRPGVVFVVGVPPRSWWMSVHPHVLHLWETRDDGLVAEFRANARGDTPT
ncbi:MAG TPA: hypothetical protein VGJ32_16765 [Solirubrobacteraceae bacterium]|jgi:hypothetical protein